MLVDFAAILQVAAIGGEPLLLCLLLWPSAALGSLHGRARLRQIGAAFLPPALCLAALVGYGAWRIQALDQAEVAGAGVSLTALPLQLDLPRHAAPSLLTRDHAKGRASALELSRDGMQQAPACELVVWPETPLDPVRQQQVCAEGQRMADRLGRPLLMQCMRDHETQRQVTAELLRPGQLSAPVFHAKSSLVPIYEQPLWGKGDLVAGPPGGVFAFDQARLIPAICYELHSRTHLRAGVLAGGNAVVHMASFAAFGPLIDVWDLGLARMRAVEFGVPIIRATNRGSVGWIDAAGRARSLSTGFGPHAQCVSVWSPAGTPTLHTQLAPIAAWLPALLVLLLGRAGGDVRPSHRSSHQPPGVNHESAT
jgi:apolipoprotein N-acyltransferase